MAYDEYLNERVINCLKDKRVSYEIKKMFGGTCFMIDGKMCIGVIEEKIMVRLNPAIYEEVLTIEGCDAMDFTGRPMKGYVYASGPAIDSEQDLAKWIQLGLDYNPLAKASKKKKKKMHK